MTTSTNIKEAILDKKSYFCIKRFKILGINVEYPLKVISIKKIPRKIFSEYEEVIPQKKRIFENSIIVVKPERVVKVVESDNDEVRNKHFGSRDWAKPLAIPITLNFNPLKDIQDRSIWTTYLDYYHEHASILFVPNIRVWRTIEIKQEDGRSKRQRVWIIDVDEYLRFVDDAVEILSYKNSKPIFVPMSLKFQSKEKLNRIVSHYLRREYFNIWIDFEGGALSKNNRARLRIILRQIEDSGRLEDVVLYVTNIKPEIESNYKEIYAPASDPLVPILGASMVGGNREPLRRIERPPAMKLPEDLIDLHKSRIFDPNTYFYVRPDALQDEFLIARITKEKSYREIVNSVRLYNEFVKQHQYFLENGEIENYVSQKEMVKTYDDGALIDELFSRRPPSKVSLLDIYSER